MSYSYSFQCPFCGGSWKFEQFAEIARHVFSSWDGVGVCPLCEGVFSWVRPGTLDANTSDGLPWYEAVTLKRYKPHPCGSCGKQLEGKRVYCNIACKQKAYRQRAALRRRA